LQTPHQISNPDESYSRLFLFGLRHANCVHRWTAVVQGAVIYGIEKASYKNVSVMSMCPRSYGIVLNEAYSARKFDSRDQVVDPLTNKLMAQGQITWLIRRGDLLLSDATKETIKQFTYTFPENAERTFNFPIYEYPDDDDDVPDRYETGQNGKLTKSPNKPSMNKADTEVRCDRDTVTCL
jgi:hypothetical protein